jgi:anti-anti-sigma regulatory factor
MPRDCWRIDDHAPARPQTSNARSGTPTCRRRNRADATGATRASRAAHPSNSRAAPAIGVAHQLPDPAHARTRELFPAARHGGFNVSAIALESDLGIEGASRLHGQLAGLLDGRRAVVLDGRAVGRLHAATLQVLVAFVRERSAAGRKTRISDPSPELSHAAVALGVASILGIESQGARA